MDGPWTLLVPLIPVTSGIEKDILVSPAVVGNFVLASESDPGISTSGSNPSVGGYLLMLAA